jgi:nucleoside-diphosphate-sugar epimerase
MRVIIAGGAGFISDRLTRDLLAGEHEVVILNR